MNNKHQINIKEFEDNSSEMLDEMLKKYISDTKIPVDSTKKIFDELIVTKGSYKKSKSFLGMLLLNFPINFDSISKPLAFYTLTALLLITSNASINKNENIEARKSKQNEILLSQPNLASKSNFIGRNNIQKLLPDKNHSKFENLGTIYNDNENVSIQKIISKSELSYGNNAFNSIISANVPLTNAYDINLKLFALPLSYECKLSRFSNLNYTNRQAPDEGILKDVSFGMWYTLTENISIGAEFRQESFSILNDNSINTINMNCWEIAAMYYADFDLEGAVPVINLNLGGGKMGMTSRINAGLSIPLSKDFNLITGCEISTLIYSNNSKIHSTERIGINIGFNLNIK